MTATVKKKARRDYGKDAAGKRRPGVTTVIGDTLGWSKHGLMMWAAKEAAKAALELLRDGGAPDEVVERARKAHLKIRDAAADAGTLAHAMIEIYLCTDVGPPEPEGFDVDDETTAKARAAFEKFRAWWPTSGYEMVEAETPLTDEGNGFGGTVDLVVRRVSDGALLVGDLKTGKSVYDEVLVQLGAYSLLLGTHRRPVIGGVVIHSPVDGERCSAVEVSPATLALGASAFSALLYVYKAKSSLKLAMDEQGGVP